MKKISLLIILVLVSGIFAADFKTIRFESKDGLKITADVYIAYPNSAPFIILFHQADSSRGEYRVIAPELNSIGFNAMAIDQRSGLGMEDVANETAEQAVMQKKSATYLDALLDMEAAVEHAKKHYAKGKVILWGSSYSAALVLKIAGDSPAMVDGVLAFSPGEYFTNLGKSRRFITLSAKNINIPVFITSAKSEQWRWLFIYEAIPSKMKSYFLPEKEGIHGSRALWGNFPEHEEYWQAVEKFLSYFLK